MHRVTRLFHDRRFGPRRLEGLSSFVCEYYDEALRSHSSASKSFPRLQADVGRLLAVAFINPTETGRRFEQMATADPLNPGNRNLTRLAALYDAVKAPLIDAAVDLRIVDRALAETLPEAWDKLAPSSATEFSNLSGRTNTSVVVGVTPDQAQELRIAEIARDRGIGLAPLRALLGKLQEAGVSDHEILGRLDKAADQMIELRTQLAQLTTGWPEVVSIKDKAGALIDQGDLDAARAALARGRETARELRENASRNEAELLADEANIDHHNLDYRAAAEKLAGAAALVALFDHDAEWKYLIAQGNELYSHGHEFEDNQSLLQAIDIYRSALTLVPRERDPIDWAMTQNSLGNALSTLGERENGTARLEEAVAAYREALKEWSRERVPLDWAVTQNNLDNALRALGERESGAARLDEAVAAYRAAMEELSHDRLPRQWATMQKNLDDTLKQSSEAALSLLPSAALASGHFFNFIVSVYSHLKTLEEAMIAGEKYSIADGNFELTIVLPRSLQDFGMEERDKYVASNGLLPYSFSIGDRGYGLFVHPPQVGEAMHFIDFPTTLRSAAEIIDLYLKEPRQFGWSTKLSDMRTQMQEREITNFGKVLEVLLEENEKNERGRKDKTMISYID
jgi:tetratricopeptide (TPR) repeat protein